MGLQKNDNQRLLYIGIALSYLITRMYNFLAVPIFTDEAIYIRWVQILIADKHKVFISLTDGKQPLFIWLGYPFLKIIHDPLLALRLVSVLSGALSLVGIYLLTSELFKNKQVALVACILYIFYPLSLVYDKLALYESLLAALSIWSLYLEVVLVRRRQIKTAILLSVVLGCALLTKSSAFLFIYLLPLSLFLFDFRSKNWKKMIVQWLVLVAIAVAGAVASYSILRLSPNFHYIADKNNTFIFPFNVWLKHPFMYVLINIRALSRMLVGYSTIPFFVLVAGAFWARSLQVKEKLLLAWWFIVPIVALAFFGKPTFLTPRYFVFMVMPLIPLVAYSVVALQNKLSSKYLAWVIILLLFSPMIYKDFLILTNLSRAPIPKEDHKQLIAGYTSGAGVKETAEFLKGKSKHGPLYVGGEGSLGLMPEGLEDYLVDNKNIRVVSMWPITQIPPVELLEAAKKMPTYVVFYAPCQLCPQAGIAPVGWPVKKIFQIHKQEKDTLYTLYQVIL